MSTLKRKAFSFLQNTKGIAATEFALILPLFLLLIFGSYGIFLMFQQNNKVDRASSVIADLVSREIALTKNQADRFIDISQALIGPLADDPSYTVVLTSVYNEYDSDGNKDLIINWSKSNKDPSEMELADLDDLDLPEIAEGDSLIIVTTEVDYMPAYLNDIVGELTFNGISVRRPRFVPLITYTRY